MHYKAIKLREHEGIATITLDRPEAMNAMDTQMRAELLHAIKAVEETSRVLVLTGRGKAFCAGQDLGAQSNVLNMDLERLLRDEYTPLIEALAECRLPTIAAVNGMAAGAGANVALACDVVIASESAKFLQAFTRIGLVPDAGGSYFMPRQMGMAKAMGAALFAEPISARQAADWGMIFEAVPEKDFADHWYGRASMLANGPTKAYRRIKRLLRESFENTLEDQLALEAKLQGEAGKTRDFREGVVAFTEKRPAKFEGR